MQQKNQQDETLTLNTTEFANKMQIDNEEEISENDTKSQKFDEFAKLYKSPALGNYVRNTKNQSVKNFISQICVLSESNSLKELTNKLIYIDYFNKRNYLTKMQTEILVNCLYSTICKNKEFYYELKNVFSALKSLLGNKHSKKIKFNFDWKIFYEILISDNQSSFEFNFRNYFFQGSNSNSFIMLLAKIQKFLKFSAEDLSFFKKNIKNLLISGNGECIKKAIGLSFIFLRKNNEFFDEEIQNLFYKLVKNLTVNTNVEAYVMLCRISTEGNLLINKEDFVNLIFERIHEFIAKKKTNLVGFFMLANDSNDKNKINKAKYALTILLKNLLNVIVNYFFDENSPKELIDLIREKLQILLNINNYQLKENTTNEQASQLLGLIKVLLISLKKKTFEKEKKLPKENNQTETDINKLDLMENMDLSEENDNEEYDPISEAKFKDLFLIPEYTEKLRNFLIEFVEPFITKSLFYQNESSNQLLYLMSDMSFNLPNVFLSENIFNIFNNLLEDDSLASGNSNWVLVKINCYLKPFFFKLIDCQNDAEKNLQNKFNNFVADSVKNISSANILNTSRIIKFVANLFNLARINYEKISTKNPKLLKILNDSIPEIFKKIINLIDMISNSKFYKSINLFFHSCITYINDLSNKDKIAKEFYQQKIEEILLDFFKENTSEASILGTVFPIIHLINSPTKLIYQKLFDHIYSCLICDSNNNKKSNNNNNNLNIENFNFSDTENYTNSEIFPEIQIKKNVELDTLNEKTLKYLESLLNYIDNRYFEFNSANIEKIYNLIGLLGNSKDKFYRKILQNLLKFVFEISNRYLICHESDEEKENNTNKILKASLPDAYKLKFCISLFKKIASPLAENLYAKKNDFMEKLNKKSSQEENCEYKFLEEKSKIKKKIKKNVKEEIEKEKLQMEQINLKFLLDIMVDVNVMKNNFLLIPHKRNKKNYENLVKEFSSEEKDLGNSVCLLGNFVEIKNEINKKILASRIYFCLYEALKTKEVLDYYFSFDYYDTKDRLTRLKKFSKDYKNLLRIFKKPEKQIFNSKVKMIYLYQHLDLFKVISHSDLYLPGENMRVKITLLINKLIIKAQYSDIKHNYVAHLSYILIKLNNEKNKLSCINIGYIYNKTLKHYEEFLDKIDPNETPSISLKTKLSNMVNAYAQFVNFYILSPAIEYSKDNNNNPENKKTNFNNNFILHKVFEDIIRFKTKLFKQNFKEINIMALTFNMVLHNILKHFPTSNYIIDKKLNSKSEYLDFIEYRNNNNTPISYSILTDQKFLTLFKKEEKRQKISENIKFYTEKNTENSTNFQKSLINYLKNYIEFLKKNSEKNGNFYLDNLNKFEGLFLIFFNMDITNPEIYEIINEIQIILLETFITNCGFLEKKFCYYMIGFISKMKYKIIIEYKVEKFEEIFNRLEKFLPENLTKEEKIYKIKTHLYNKNKTFPDPKIPSEIFWVSEKKINFENLLKINNNSNNSDKKISEFLNNEEKMKKFVEALLLMKQNHKDEILQNSLSENEGVKNHSFMDVTFVMNKSLAPFFYPGKCIKNKNDIDLVSYGKKKTLLCGLESNLIFYTFMVYDFNNWDLIEKIFADLNMKISNTNTNNTNTTEESIDHVHMSVYLIFSAAYLRKMQIFNKFNSEKIKKLFYHPLYQYGNLRNESINMEILTFYYFIIHNCAIENLGVLLYDNITNEILEENNSLTKEGKKLKLFQENLQTENLIIFKDEFFSKNKILLMKFLGIFTENTTQTNFIFNKETIKNKFEDFILNTLDNKNTADLIKNLYNFSTFIQTFFYLSDFYRKNYQEFIKEYPKEKTEDFNKVLFKLKEKCNSLESKKIKLVLQNIFVNNKSYFISDSNLFLEYSKEIIHYESLDENYEHLAKNLKDFMVSKDKNCDLFNIIAKLIDLLNSSENENLNLVKKNLILSTIANFVNYFVLKFTKYEGKGINRSLNLINELVKLMNNSQVEVRDLISKELMVNLLMTLSSEDKMNLLDKLISQLNNCSPNVYSVNSNLDKEIITQKISENLTCIYLIGSYLLYFDLSKSHFVEIDKIVVCIRNFNKKCLKNKGAESKILKGIITDFFNRYKHTFEYVRMNLSEEAIETINDLSKSHSYFM